MMKRMKTIIMKHERFNENWIINDEEMKKKESMKYFVSGNLYHFISNKAYKWSSISWKSYFFKWDLNS